MKLKLIFKRLTLIFAALPLLASASDQIWIEWNPNQEADFDHYFVYRSVAPKALPDIPSDQIATIQAAYYIDSDVETGGTYYYWISSVDLFGNASICSGPLVIALDAGSGEQEPGIKLIAFNIQHADQDFYEDDPFVDRTLDNDNSIEFSWELSLTGDLLYKVYLSMDQGDDLLKAVTEVNHYIVENALSGSSYRIRVDVLNADQQLYARGFSDEIRCELSSVKIETPGIPRVLEYE